MSETGPWVSERAAAIALSAIKEMAMRSARVEGAVSLAWGVPSFRTPAHIRRAVEERLESDADIGKYSLPDGLPELRRAAARAHRDATGREPDPDTQVMITAGNMEGLSALFRAVVDPGDEVVVTDPGFSSHIAQIRLCGGRPVFWRLDEQRGWALDPEALPGLLGDRTKAILLVNPSNPTGRIFEPAHLRRVGEIAAERGLLLMLDDPYRHFLYENRKRFFNLASLPELAGQTAYLFTLSKAYAMTGWRVGYMVLPEHLKRQVIKVHDATMICAPRVSQVAALAALGEEPVHLAEFEAALARRRALICERLARFPHVFESARPQGAYYVFPRIVVPHEDAFSFAVDLLETARVSVTPGVAFGPAGEHHVRMAYCASDEAIEQAFDRIEQRYPA